MSALSEMLNEAMKEKKHSIRTLEAATVEKFGEDKKISRSLVSDYLIGVRAPTYVNAIILSELLDLDKTEFLVQTFHARQEDRKKAEEERFLRFCCEKGIGIKEKDILK